MPLSRAKMRERKRQDRLNVKPKSNLRNKPLSNLNTIEQVRQELGKLPPVRPYSKASQLGITKRKQAVWEKLQR